MLKVGDICYTHWAWGKSYAHVSKCEVRKVEVKWIEPESWRGDSEGHWRIDYYIRTDIDKKSLKSTKMNAYGLYDNDHISQIYLTPQEVMEDNIRRFKKDVMLDVEQMRKSMARLGYSEAQIKQLGFGDE